MSLKEEIKMIASEIKEDVINKRRFLHQHPELSFEEFQTSAFIKESLDTIGVSWTTIAGTGVLATIIGLNPSKKVIALRADMDALPVLEKNSFNFKSLNEGKMHACGHDLHMASLLGVAEILNRLKNKFEGTVKLLFQPAEEVLPGGAIKAIEEGFLQNPPVEAIIGQHVMPSIPAGKVALRKGVFMASMDQISIKIIGKGGHAAEPHKNIDPVIAASTIIVTLQQIVSRNNNPETPTVLSFGKVQANGSFNIIPDEVLIEGTFRTMNEQWREEAHSKIKSITKSVAEGLGCSCVIDINKGYPCLYNDPLLGDKTHQAMEEYLGVENILDADIWMASEDFAYYSQEIPSCFYLLGVGHSQVENASLHTSTLNISEDAIEVSIGLMAYLALKA